MEVLKNIQQELKAPKGQYNSFGKYKYRSAEDILEAVKPLLGKCGAQLTLTDDIIEVGGRIYVKATAKLTDGKEEAVTTAFAREPAEKKGMDESQITGTASSYARKYALNGLFLIDDTKDADTDEYSKQQGKQAPKQQAAPQKPTERKISATGAKALESLIARARANRDEILQQAGVVSINDLTAQQGKELYEMLKERVAK